MKKIVQLPEIPRDAEFEIKKRAQALMDLWAATAAPSASNAPANDDKAASPAKASETKEADAKPKEDEAPEKQDADETPATNGDKPAATEEKADDTQA